MARPTDLTAECKAGYDTLNAHVKTNPWLFSSDSWLAFEAGKAIMGMSGIRSARKSRGYSIRIETPSHAIVLVKFSGVNLDKIEIERN